MKSIQVQVRVKAILGITVFADTLEAAKKIVESKLMRNYAVGLKDAQVIDGHEEIIGVSENNWDLD